MDHHFLICGGSDAWEESLFKPIASLCKTVGNPILHSHFANNTRLFLRSLPTNPDLQQTSLGWESIFCGLLSTEWEIIHQQRSIQTNTCTNLITKLITILLQAIVARWKARNQALHHNQDNTPETRQRLINQVRALYECRESVLPVDRLIFWQPLHNILQQSNGALQTFLKQHHPLVKRSIKEYHTQKLRQHRNIVSYFIRNSVITRVTPGQ